MENSKVETLTYLPIIGINELFVSRLFYPIVRATIVNLSETIEGYSIGGVLIKNYLPKLEEVEFLRHEFLELIRKNNKSEKNINKILLGLDLTKDIIDPKVKLGNTEILKEFFQEREYNKMKMSIVRNSNSNDLHFLPADKEDPEWSPIYTHSTVLFRYPITAPIEIFENANDINCIDWQSKMDEMCVVFPIAAHFREIKPLKCAKLQQRYLSDLLTRFVALYLRLGSPDFDEETLKRISQEF